MKQIKLILPYPPSVNNMYTVRGGRKVLSDNAIQWGLECIYKNKPFIGSKLEECIKAFILVYPPDKRKRDIDNIVKPILDIGKKLKCYEDDKQIVLLTVIKKNFIRNRGFVEVTFSNLEDGINEDGFYYLG